VREEEGVKTGKNKLGVRGRSHEEEADSRRKYDQVFVSTSYFLGVEINCLIK
jgi:hypothetical protein